MADFILVVLPYVPVVLVVCVVIFLLLLTIRVASGNEALVITGIGAMHKAKQRVVKRVPKVVKKMVDGVEVEVKTYDKVEEYCDVMIPKIKIAGAAFVIPFLQKSAKFDLCTREARKDNDTMKTSSGVEIEADWGISYWPNSTSESELAPCVRQFLDKKDNEIQLIIMNAVAGGMRAVVSTMTPQEVMIGKETLDDRVQENIADQISELGFKVQIYIHEVRDAAGSTYYQDLAAKDREETRRNAALITADASRDIRKREADAKRQGEEAEIEADVKIAEKQKERDVKKSEFKAETDIKAADANVAGELQKITREKELATKAGDVEVEKQKQANLAAMERQQVAITEAETSKQQAIIASKAEAEKRTIEAEAQATVVQKEAVGKAEAAKAEADGEAAAVRIKAEGEAEATKKTAEAEAKKIELTGEAEAKAISAKGKADAEAILAKGSAQAEAERALSDARAANNQVNFEIQKFEIEQKAKVEIATNVATVMAEVGKNAKFYDFGGKGIGNGKMDLLSSVMSNLPEVMAKANLTGQALNDENVTDTLSDIASAIFGPLKGDANRGSTSIVSADTISGNGEDNYEGDIEPSEPSEDQGEEVASEEDPNITNGEDCDIYSSLNDGEEE